LNSDANDVITTLLMDNRDFYIVISIS